MKGRIRIRIIIIIKPSLHGYKIIIIIIIVLFFFSCGPRLANGSGHTQPLAQCHSHLLTASLLLLYHLNLPGMNVFVMIAFYLLLYNCVFLLTYVLMFAETKENC